MELKDIKVGMKVKHRLSQTEEFGFITCIDNGVSRNRVRVNWITGPGKECTLWSFPENIEEVKEETMKNKPHIHAEVIKAWADGAIIEHRYHDQDYWLVINEPNWRETQQYRVKPEPKPDVVYFSAVYTNTVGYPYNTLVEIKTRHDARTGIIKVVHCGETRKLKSVEIVE